MRKTGFVSSYRFKSEFQMWRYGGKRRGNRAHSCPQDDESEPLLCSGARTQLVPVSAQVRRTQTFTQSRTQNMFWPLSGPVHINDHWKFRAVYGLMTVHWRHCGAKISSPTLGIFERWVAALSGILFETFHSNELHLNVGISAVNQKMCAHGPAVVPLFTVCRATPGSVCTWHHLSLSVTLPAVALP